MAEPPFKAPAGRRSDSKHRANPLSLVGTGLELGGIVAMLTLLGWWLDRRYDLTPWLMLTGAFIGIVGGLYNVYRQGKRYFK